jgi:hypothetical protein
MTDPFADRPARVPRRRFQYSLQTLFIVSFLFALFCAGIFSKYDGIRLLTLLLFLITYPMVALSLAIYGRGYLRSFGIGASITFFPFSIPGIFFLYLAYMGMATGFSVAAPDSPVDLSNTSSLADGVAFLWPSLSAAGVVLFSFILGTTVVLTRWIIDRSRRKQSAAAPLTVPPAVPAPHFDAALITNFQTVVYSSNAEEGAVR